MPAGVAGQAAASCCARAEVGWPSSCHISDFAINRPVLGSSLCRHCYLRTSPPGPSPPTALQHPLSPSRGGGGGKLGVRAGSTAATFCSSSPHGTESGTAAVRKGQATSRPAEGGCGPQPYQHSWGRGQSRRGAGRPNAANRGQKRAVVWAGVCMGLPSTDAMHNGT
jgi:hypothetical protein